MSSDAASKLLAELEREAKTTRRLLKRVPSDKLGWKPHPKSRSLGQLAAHVAGIPGNISRRVQSERMDVGKARAAIAEPEPGADFVADLDAGVAQAREVLSGWNDADALVLFRVSHGDEELFAMPRGEAIRTMLLNHWYHHRGQMTVYLRILDVPVPAVYGRSADEEPRFGPEPPRQAPETGDR